MKRFLMILPLIVLLAAGTLLSGCGYNTMQANEETVKAAWGDVEASYQRRADLVPNLVETVKAYAKHERETLAAVTEARSRAGEIKLTPQMIEDPQAMAKRSESTRL